VALTLKRTALRPVDVMYVVRPARNRHDGREGQRPDAQGSRSGTPHHIVGDDLELDLRVVRPGSSALAVKLYEPESPDLVTVAVQRPVDEDGPGVVRDDGHRERGHIPDFKMEVVAGGKRSFRVKSGLSLRTKIGGRVGRLAPAA